MIIKQPFPVKKTVLFSLITVIGLALSYITFLSLVSVYVGLGNTNQDGFWIPVICGILVIIFCVVSFIVLLKIIKNQLTEKDIIHF